MADLLASIRKGLLDDDRESVRLKALGEARPKLAEDEQLIWFILLETGPKTWSAMGGLGTLDYEPGTASLVVRQTPDALKRVEELISAMRRGQDNAVNLDVRFVVVSDEHFGKLGIRGEGGTVLDEASTRRLLADAQTDPNAASVVAPTTFCFGQQKLTVDLCDRRTVVTGRSAVLGRPGFLPQAYPVGPSGRSAFVPRTPALEEIIQAYVQPIPSGEGACITLRLGVKVARDDPRMSARCGPRFGGGLSPAEQATTRANYARQPRIGTFEFEATMKVPDGHTAVLCGRGSRSEASAPASVAHVLVLVRPRPQRSK